jgi:MFS family permease
MFHRILVDEYLSLYFIDFEMNLGQVFFYFFYLLSLFIGAILSTKLNRKKLLVSWIILGVAANFLLFSFHSRSNIFFLLALTGISLGFGLPSCFSFLAESTSFENRGRVSSIIQFLIFLQVFIVFIIIGAFNFNLNQMMLFGVVIRLSTLIPLYLDTFEKEKFPTTSWGSIFSSRKTIFFLIPWILLSLSNGVLIFFDKSIMAIPELDRVNITGNNILLIGTSVFGLLSGFLADRSGRKQPLVLGFIALGISYSFVGISTTPTNLMIMLLISGIGWGFVTVIQQWVVFGELSPPGDEEKYYTLVLATYPLFESLFRFLESILNLSIPPNVVAIFVSIILFVSVFPLLLVPETLPDELIKDRRFKEYLRKVLEVVEETTES